MGARWTDAPDHRYGPEQRNGPPEFYADRDGADYHPERVLPLLLAWVLVLVVAGLLGWWLTP